MICSLCGFRFDEDTARSACSGCGLVKRCGLARCPRCGFEMPREPAWLKKLRKRRNRDGADG